MMRGIRLTPRPGNVDARLADLRSEIVFDAMIRHLRR